MYELVINSMSPYSMKASAFIGYAGLDCETHIQHIVDRYATVERLTGDTMIPVLRKGDWAINDSSRIARWVADETDTDLFGGREELAALCWILEDFADEWIAKIALFSRWHHREDERELARRIGDEMTGKLPGLGRVVGPLLARAIEAALAPAGVKEENRDALEHSRDRLLQAMETLLEDEPPFLFSAEPSIADFALYGQLGQYKEDPSGGRKLRMYPNLSSYLRLLDAMTLPHPILRAHRQRARDVSELRAIFAEFLGTYWRVLVANHRAVADDRRGDWTTAELLDGRPFRFRASGYFVGRLEFILGQIDEAYASRREIFGEEGLEIEHALITQLARLSEHEAGRALLDDYPNISADGSDGG